MIQPNLPKLSTPERKRLKGLGHHLKPVVIIGSQGLSAGVMAELERALTDHELIKVRMAAGDREERAQMTAECLALSGAQLVAQTGRMMLLYRRHPERNAPHSWAE